MNHSRDTQVGDTHLHKPGKDDMRSEFFKWYRPRVVDLLSKLEAAKIAARKACDDEIAAAHAAYTAALA